MRHLSHWAIGLGLLGALLSAGVLRGQTSVVPGTIPGAGENVVQNPALTQIEGDQIVGWGKRDPQRMSVVTENGQAFLRLTSESNDRVTAIRQVVALQPGWKVVVVTAKMRATGLKLGPAGWNEARVALRFTDDQGKQIGGYPDMPRLRADSDWVTQEILLEKPEGATRLQLEPGLWVAAGTLDMTDITVRGYATRLDMLRGKARPFVPGFPEGQWAKLTSDGKPAGWELQEPEAFSVVEKDGQKVLRVATENKASWASATLTTAAGADWTRVRVRFRMQADAFMVGPETAPPRPLRWRQGGVHVVFINEQGKEINDGFAAFVGPNMDPLRGKPGWLDFDVTGGVPSGAVLMRVTVGLFNATGELFVSPIRIESSTEDLLIDAKLPNNVKLDWGREPVQILTPARDQINLDGVWQFVMAEGRTEKTPGGWGYIRVPADWKKSDAVLARGESRDWLNFQPDKLGRAWYQRQVRIPAEWAGRAVILQLDRVSTDAQVFIGDKQVGAIEWPGGSVDLTPHLKPGQTITLRLRVIAVDDRTQVPIYMGYATNEMTQAKLDTRGIIGGVSLLSRPGGAYIADVLVRPSTRSKTLNVDAEVAGLQQPTELTFTAELLDMQGKVEKTFTTKTPASASAQQTLTLSWPWADARWWDLEQPNLYTLRLRMQGAGSDDTIAQTFGFREFWIEGRKFFLNNTEIHLRPGNIDYGAMPENLLKNGMNFGHVWPKDLTRRGSDIGYFDRILAQGRQIGLPLGAIAPSMGEYANRLEKWEDPAVRSDYQRQVDYFIRRWRNNPAVVMWTHSANVFQNQVDGTPWLLGRKDFSNVQEYVERLGNVQQCIDMIKKADPTRPVYAHFGTYAGDVYTSNMYLNFIPLQEREEWLSQWVKDGQMPFMAVEFGMPLYSSLQRVKDGYTPQGHSEPWLSEWCARYLGSEAYKLEPAEYRKLLWERYKGGNLMHEYDPHLRQNGADRILWNSEAFSRVLDLYVTNTWRSWRTLGVTGGMIPWHQDSTRSMKPVNGPSLAWIAGDGPAPDPAQPEASAFTAKDHHFAVGQTLRKQVVLINDYRTPQPYSAKWSVTVGTQVVAQGQKTGELAVGQILMLPVEATLPGQVADGRQDGRLTLAAGIGNDQLKDEFAFTVFAPMPTAAGELVVFDPAGRTAAMLQTLGYTVKPWTQGQPPARSVVVIGQRALSDGGVIPGDIEAFVKAGGRALVMGQDPRWVNYALYLRTATHLARRVYRIDPQHPVARGLSDDNLRDWNGSSRLTQAYPHHPGYEWAVSQGWHWGNRGAVTSCAIEKPHRSSWRPVLETEFDLAYTPLMEMDYGAGRLTFCTLDLEDHIAADPAARQLAQQTLAYVYTAALRPKASLVQYLGDEAGAKMLTDLGVNYQRGSQLDSRAGLVIVGAGADVEDAALKAYAQGGGKVAVLLKNVAGDHRLGAKVKKVAGFYGSVNPPAWEEAAGLSASDLRWRSTFDGLLLEPTEGLEIGADGLLGRMRVGTGVVMFLQVSPEYLPADAKRFFRFSRWRMTRATAQVLANLGASFASDAQFLALLKQPDMYQNLVGLWDVQLTKAVPESPRRKWNSDAGMTDLARKLVQVDAPAAGWEKLPVPAYMESYGPKWRFTDGECVFRTVVHVPAHLAGHDLFVCVGRVDENEITFFNGVEVGKSRSWLWPRGHRIPGKLVQAGDNVLALRTWDEGIHGGMCADPMQLYVRGTQTPPGFYHPDYLSSDVSAGEDEKAWGESVNRWKYADDPYRYYRW